MGFARGQRTQMRFIIKARDSIIGLGLQIGGRDAPFRCRMKLRHTAPIQQIGHQRRDEHRLARARQTRNTQSDHRFKQRFIHSVARTLHRSDESICEGRNNHVRCLTLL